MYDAKLLEKALPLLIMSKWAGNPRLVKHSWPVRLWRWLLRKEPEYEFDPPFFQRPLPENKGHKLTFRRYQPLGTPPPVGAVQTKTGLCYVDETLNYDD